MKLILYLLQSWIYLIIFMYFRFKFSFKIQLIECYLLFTRPDVRAHLTIQHQISSDIYLVNLRIKSDVESSEGIWHSSDIFLTPFWWIKRQCPLANLGININTLKFAVIFIFFKAEWCIEIHIFKETLYHFQSFLKTHNTEMLKKFLYFLNIIDKFFSVLGALVICIDNQLFITVCIIMNSVSIFSSFSWFFSLFIWWKKQICKQSIECFMDWQIS